MTVSSSTSFYANNGPTPAVAVGGVWRKVLWGAQAAAS